MESKKEVEDFFSRLLSFEEKFSDPYLLAGKSLEEAVQIIGDFHNQHKVLAKFYYVHRDSFNKVESKMFNYVGRKYWRFVQKNQSLHRRYYALRKQETK
jgi:hypothetical protein